MKYEREMSWRRISAWLNSAGIKTHRGKTWSETGSSVHSVIKRMQQRTERIEQIKNRQFSTEISDFIIGYSTLTSKSAIWIPWRMDKYLN